MANISIKDYAKRIALKTTALFNSLNTKVNGMKETSDANTSAVAGLTTRTTILETNVNNITPRVGTLETNVAANTAAIASNTTGVSDYYNSKGGFAKLSDIIGNKSVDVSSINWVESGNNLTATFTTELTPFTDNQRIDVTMDNDLNLTDTYNNGTPTPQAVSINGVTVNITFNTTPTLFTLTGLNQTQRAYMIASANPKTVYQLGGTSGGVGIDQTARDAASAAQVMANTADGKADSNALAITTINGTLTTTTATANAANTAATANAAAIAANTAALAAKQNAVDAGITVAGANGNVVQAINAINTQAFTTIPSALDGKMDKAPIPYKDITTEYISRDWTLNDIGKEVRIYVGPTLIAISGKLMWMNFPLVPKPFIGISLTVNELANSNGNPKITFTTSWWEQSNEKGYVWDLSSSGTDANTFITKRKITKFEIREP